MTFDSRLYLVAPARFQAGELQALVPELAEAGVDAIQLREKDMEAGDLMRVAEPILDRCRGLGIPFIVNDRPDVAFAIGADGVHVGQNDIPVRYVRTIFPEAIVGLSTHAPSEVDATTNEALDYFAVGPVFETPTKPGRPSVGLELIRHATEVARHPWFGIGGIDETNIERVLGAGARRVVVVRAITEAPDPPRAAARLRQHIDAWV